MKTIRTLLAATLAIASGTAAAVPVTLNAVTGTWSDVVGGKNVEYRDGNQEIRWGAGGKTSYKDKSGYRFDANNSAATFDTSETFSLGVFTHYNKPIPTGTAITAATLNVATELDILGTTIHDGPYNFVFGHTETLNNKCGGDFISKLLCEFGLRQGTGYVDDIVLLDTAVQSNEFIVDSYVFSLEILGFQGINQPQYSAYGTGKGKGKDKGKHHDKPKHTCVASPIINGTLYTQENCATSADLIARLNVREVPAQVSEPASIALLGISLVGLAMHRRRRTQ